MQKFKWIVMVAILAMILASGAFVGMHAHAASGETTLYPGETLTPGQALYSDWCNYVLVMQHDGNLVEYDPIHNWSPIWASNTSGNPESSLIAQSDGNFVIKNRFGIVIWSSDTWEHPGSVLTIQNDANIVVYADHRPIWSKTGSNVLYLTQWEAQTLVNNASISVYSSGNCTDRNNNRCTSFDGIRRNTIAGIIAFKQTSLCPITITAGDEFGHSTNGTYTHGNGYKVDISPFSCVTDYIHTHFSYKGIRGDGAPMYADTHSNIYAFEYWKNHWDVLYY